ncbi:hypothetical protein [Leucobacter viscericola]|uniref:hypothetical protein n=1 Tax=Leucobacter viscericola TaxID=2714935 RepID=UPI0019823362|nr:hypothetical protein [Leucobacter viscericola]
MFGELVSELVTADVVLIDGRSGSGKTSLAEKLVGRLGALGRRVQVLRVEDLYPGWDGLAEGSRAVAEALAAGRYRRYDWELGAFAEWVTINETTPLIIEGCGAITRENLAAAEGWAVRENVGNVRSVWIECPTELRRSRALARDGKMFAPHWDRWAAQEEALFSKTRPDLLAELAFQCRECGSETHSRR